MGSLSIWHWLIVLIWLVLFVGGWIAVVRILVRTGYSGWWSLLILVPFVNLIALWMFSKASWPALQPLVKG